MKGSIGKVSAWGLCPVLILVLSSMLPVVSAHRQPTYRENAVVTLVSGHKSGYAYGAVALGESLKLHGSKMHRIAMITPDVDHESRQLIALLWDIVEVEPIYCRDRSSHLPPGILPASKEGYAEGLQRDMKRFETTCTKFRAWTFTEYDRFDSATVLIIFSLLVF